MFKKFTKAVKDEFRRLPFSLSVEAMKYILFGGGSLSAFIAWWFREYTIWILECLNIYGSPKFFGYAIVAIITMVPVLIVLGLLLFSLTVIQSFRKRLSREQCLIRLRDHLKRGQDVLKQNINSQLELMRWKTDYDTWKGDVQEEIGEYFSPGEATIVTSAGSPEPKEFPESYDDWHNQKRNRLFVRISKLEKFIERQNELQRSN